MTLWRLPEQDNGNGGEFSRLTQDLKAKILQYILIPCFSWSFEHGEGDKLIGSPPAPDDENNSNVVSAFIQSIIDLENPFGTSLVQLEIIKHHHIINSATAMINFSIIFFW